MVTGVAAFRPRVSLAADKPREELARKGVYQ